MGQLANLSAPDAAGLKAKNNYTINFSHAELETYSVNRTVVEQQQVNSVVSSQTLVDDFNLELVVSYFKFT